MLLLSFRVCEYKMSPGRSVATQWPCPCNCRSPIFIFVGGMLPRHYECLEDLSHFRACFWVVTQLVHSFVVDLTIVIAQFRMVEAVPFVNASHVTFVHSPRVTFEWGSSGRSDTFFGVLGFRFRQDGCRCSLSTSPALTRSRFILMFIWTHRFCAAVVLKNAAVNNKFWRYIAQKCFRTFCRVSHVGKGGVWGGDSRLHWAPSIVQSPVSILTVMWRPSNYDYSTPGGEYKIKLGRETLAFGGIRHLTRISVLVHIFTLIYNR